MPAYNFKDQFVALVQSGAKTTTIRQVRQQRPTRVGDPLYLFNRMRQAKCFLIKTTECVAITPIKIYTGILPGIMVGGARHVEGEELVTFSRRDGFKSVSEFFKFFADNYGEIFEGEVIEWKP